MTHGLQPYPEYKDAGVRWLGQIPAHWEIRAAKRLFAESGERARPDDIQLSATQSHGVIPQAEYERLVGRKVVRILNHLDKRKHVETDDFVISMRSFQGGLERAWARGAIRSSYVVLKPRRDVHVPYFAHLFKSNPYIQALRATCQFIRDGQDLTFANFCQVPLPVMPVDEQRAIAEFLDASAARIRRFIRNRRRLIEVLNEQKQAIIDESIAPSRWPARRVRTVAELRVSNVDKHTKPDEHPVRLCNYTDVYKNAVISADMPFMAATATAEEIAAFRLQVGDVIITKDSEDWEDIGVPALVAESADDLVCGYHLAILRPKPTTVTGPFLAYALRSKGVVTQFSVAANGVTRYGLSHGAIKAVAVPVPPLEAQDRIVRQIDNATASINSAIYKAAREIELIQECRTRLIADVVTGKLDVRHLAAGVDSVKQPTKHANIHFQRAVFAAEIVHRLHNEPTLGHVKFEKLIFLCEKWCGVETGSTYRRQAAGPYDNRALRSIDSQLKKQRWYEAQRGDKGYRYVPLEKAGGHSEYFNRYFKDVIARFDEIIDTFRPLDTQRCEIVATLYAAWEDLLALGDATDDQIIEQVLQHWHPSKQKIPEDRWRKALGWMREKGLTPKMEAICVRK